MAVLQVMILKDLAISEQRTASSERYPHPPVFLQNAENDGVVLERVYKLYKCLKLGELKWLCLQWLADWAVVRGWRMHRRGQIQANTGNHIIISHDLSTHFDGRISGENLSANLGVDSKLAPFDEPDLKEVLHSPAIRCID